MGEFKDWPINLLLAGVFMISIIGYMAGIGETYGVDMSTPYIDVSRIQDQVEETSEDANAWAEAFKSDNLFVSTGTIVLFSVWGVSKLVWDAIITFITIYLDLFATLFGIPPLVTGVITAVVLISLIYQFWKLIKIGT